MLQARYAILLDGGFVTRKLNERLGHPPTADDVVALCADIQACPLFATYELMRIYYYDAPPSTDSVRMPVSGNELQLAITERARHAQSLYDQLELKDGFALRMGETRLSPFQWKIKPNKALQLIKQPR